MSEIPLIGAWEGKRLERLTKAQLIAIIMTREEQHKRETVHLQASREMWMKSTFELANERVYRSRTKPHF